MAKRPFSTKKVREKKNALSLLTNQKKILESQIKNSNLEMEILSSKKINESTLNKLPIESIKELYNPTYSAMQALNDHSNHRKKILSYDEDLKKIEFQIQEARIELIQEKINSILENL
jgi:hypothetical protein